MTLFDAYTPTEGEDPPLAYLKFTEQSGIGFYWLPDLFSNPALALPDEVRAEIVQILRFHADKLESRETDERMKRIAPYGKGAA